MAEAARAGLAPATRVLISVAAATICIVGITLGREFLAPLILAAVMVIIVHPLRGMITRAGGPSWLGTITVIATAYAILAALAVVVVFALAQFVSLLPQYSDDFAAVLADIRGWLAGIGFDDATVEEDLAAIDPVVVGQAALAAVSGLLGWLLAFVLVLAYILFAAVDSAHYGDLAQRFSGTHGRAIASMRGFTSGVRRYMVVNAVFGLVVAVLDGLLLLALGVPGVFIWAVLAFVTNFIPNIGFVIGVIPPFLLALATGGWGAALAVLAGYCVINFTMQELVQPKFVSDAVGLSLTLTFASVVFWTMVIGPIGAILAVPLSLFVRAILFDVDPDARWSRALSGADPEGDPPPVETPTSA